MPMWETIFIYHHSVKSSLRYDVPLIVSTICYAFSFGVMPQFQNIDPGWLILYHLQLHNLTEHTHVASIPSSDTLSWLLSGSGKHKLWLERVRCKKDLEDKLANECGGMRVFTAKKFIIRWFSIHALLICIAPCVSQAVFNKLLKKMQKQLADDCWGQQKWDESEVVGGDLAVCDLSSVVVIACVFAYFYLSFSCSGCVSSLGGRGSGWWPCGFWSHLFFVFVFVTLFVFVFVFVFVFKLVTLINWPRRSEMRARQWMVTMRFLQQQRQPATQGIALQIPPLIFGCFVVFLLFVCCLFYFCSNRGS